jgi:branched-chain amino acid transport system substrate-binding protein
VIRTPVVAACLAAAFLAAGSALAGSAADPGITSGEILIGGTAPISGEASSAAAVARGAEAYFKWVNARGGVNGRKISYTYLDDGYDPARTVPAVRQLVQQEQVFAVFNTLGTNNNLAVRDFLNQSQVPQLFVASGANTWGADYKKYPWTIGFIPSYILEGRVYGRYIVRKFPKLKLAVLYQDDAYGKDMIAGLRKGLGKNVKQIVGQVGYDPSAADVSSQVAQLKASKANAFLIFAFGKFSVQATLAAAKLGWKPKLVIVNAVASSANLMGLAEVAGGESITRGAMSIVFFKDPTDPRWAKDKGLALERQILKRYGPAGANEKDGYYVAGMASAAAFVDVLRRAGRNPTRASVMKAARSMKMKNHPFVIPGIVVKTSAKDGFPMEQVALQRWVNGKGSATGNWSMIAGVLTAQT